MPLGRAIGSAIGRKLGLGLFGNGRPFYVGSSFVSGEQGFVYEPDSPATIYARRNILVKSDQFDDAAWTKTNATIVTNGYGTMEMLVEDTTSNTHTAFVPTATGAGTYTYSINARRAVGVRDIALQINAVAAPTVASFASFDLATGIASAPTVLVAGLTNVSAAMVPMGNGVYRCSITFTVPSTTTTVSAYAHIFNNALGGRVYLGDGVSGIYIGSAQLEFSAFATAYQAVTDWDSDYVAALGIRMSNYQDSAGTTPVTAVEQPVGLMLDKRLGLVRGVELCTNGKFDVDTSGWASFNSATLSVVAGAMRIMNTAPNGAGQISFATVAGMWYAVEMTTVAATSAYGIIASTTNGLSGNLGGCNLSGTGKRTFAFLATTTVAYIAIASYSPNGVALDVDDVSFKQIPGNHATQPTAAARPALSARKNWLLATENFGSASWMKLQAGTGIAPTTTNNYGVAPDGTTTAARLQLDLGATPATAVSRIYQSGTQGSGVAGQWRNSIWVCTNDGSTKTIYFIHNGSVLTYVVNATWQQLTGSIATMSDYSQLQMGLDGSVGTSNTADLLVWHPQCETGPTATRYQRVTTASDYDAVGFVTYDKLDGVDDEFIASPIALGASMDYFVALYRTSAGNLMLGKATAASTATAYFGVVASGSAVVANTNAGTPTYYVNGVAVPGGTGTTRDQLHLAIPLNQWCVVEARNLDLSAWTAFAFGLYSGFTSPFNVAGIVLCPAQSAAKRDSIRRYLATKSGVTL